MTKAITTQPQGKLIERMAARFGVDADKMMTTLKATAFRAKGGGVITNEQMMALLVVAEQYKLNPWTKEIYAFPDQTGIVPVVGVDGWSRIINEHPQFDGMDFETDGDESCTCRIYRKDRSHPIAVTEYMNECKRDTGPWKSHPRRMLRHKTMIQCARLAFGFAGIYDPDEAERIIDASVVDVTPRAAPALPQANAKPAIINGQQLGLLLDRCAAAEVPMAMLAEALEIDTLGALPFDRLDEALDMVDTLKAAANA